jgi:isopenicillin-N N-acyltransferase like protein
MAAELPYIRATGTHREVGRQIGEAARDLVARGLTYYEENYPLLAGITFAEALERTRPYLAVAERHLPLVVDQLRGVAEGSGLALERLFAWNCCEEFTCLPEHPGPGADDRPRGPRGCACRREHCTSFAFVAGDRIVAGHNEDWYPGDVDTLTVRHVTLTGGPSYISIGPAGYLPITGVTSNGFSSAANTLYSEDMQVGVPNNLLLTSLLECPDLDAVLAHIESLPRARGSNHLLCDARGRILDVETTANHLAAMDGGSPFVHTNHYLSPDMLPLEAYRSEGTPRRYARAAELLAAGLAAGDDPVEVGKRVLRDHANAPLSICAHWNDDDESRDLTVTTASMVWEPAAGRVHVAVGQPCEHEFVTYSL